MGVIDGGGVMAEAHGCLKSRAWVLDRLFGLPPPTSNASQRLRHLLIHSFGIAITVMKSIATAMRTLIQNLESGAPIQADNAAAALVSPCLACLALDHTFANLRRRSKHESRPT